MPYVINADPSGLEDEDIKLVDEWMLRNGYSSILAPSGDVDEEKRFTYYPAFGKGTDVVPVLARLSGKTAEDLQSDIIKMITDPGSINPAIRHKNYAQLAHEWYKDNDEDAIDTIVRDACEYLSLGMANDYVREQAEKAIRQFGAYNFQDEE